MQATLAILRGRYDEGMALAQEAGPSGAARCAAGWYRSPRSPPRRCLLNTFSDSSLASIDTSLTQWIALRLVALPSTSPWWDSPQTVMAPQNDGVSPDDPLPLSLPPGPAPVAPPNAAAVLNLTAADYGRMAAALTLYQVLSFGDETVADQGSVAGATAPRKLDDRSWWNYCGADAGSNNYRLFFGRGLTRCFVATRAEEMSARTGAGILLQLLFDIAKPDRCENPPKVRPADRALNAPTSAAWIKP